MSQYSKEKNGNLFPWSEPEKEEPMIGAGVALGLTGIALGAAALTVSMSNLVVSMNNSYKLDDIQDMLEDQDAMSCCESCGCCEDDDELEDPGYEEAKEESGKSDLDMQLLNS